MPRQLQQAGPQQDFAFTGFTPRMKVLMNLPSIWRDSVGVNSLGGKNVTRILGAIDTSWLNFDLLKAGIGQLRAILDVYERCWRRNPPTVLEIRFHEGGGNRIPIARKNKSLKLL